MKNRILTYALPAALFLSLVSINAVQASDTALNPEIKNNSKFKEITLFDQPSYDAPSVLIASDTSDATQMTPEGYTLERTVVEEVKKPQLTPYQVWVRDFSDVFTLRGKVHKEIPTNQELSGKEAEQTVVKQWLDGSYATGRWFGARPILEDHGVTINSGLLYSPFMKTGGGANDGRTSKGYSLFNLSVTVDTEKAGMWKGGTFYALYQKKTGYGISGPNGDSGAMGDWMGLDGWDWRQINQMSEYWYQHKMFKDKLRLKVGKQDANMDFGYLNTGWDFMNTAFSINPTTPMPTYPDQAFGFVAEINPKEWVSVRNGIYSRFNVPFNITEVTFKPTIKKLPGRYMLGAWEMSDSSGMSTATGMNSYGNTVYNNFNRNMGAYAGFEQMIYKEKKDDPNDMQGLTLFGQAGISPSEKNDMSKYIGGGLHYIGPIPKRDKDRVGIALANGTFASRLNNVGADYGVRNGSETVLEAFYRVQVNPWFYLQPDVQFIMNPGGVYNNSVAIGLRSVITF